MNFRDFSGLVFVFLAVCLAPAFSFAADSGLDDPLAGSDESQVVTRDTSWTIEELADNIGGFSHVSVAADGPEELLRRRQHRPDVGEDRGFRRELRTRQHLAM